MKYSNHNQNFLMTKVHQLVINIISSRAKSDSIISDSFINELNNLYQPFMYCYEPDNELVYSMPINAFFISTQLIVGDQYPNEVIWDNSNVAELIDRLRCYKREINREKCVLKYEEGKNKESLGQYITQLFNHHARLIFVRVDLKYAKDCSHLITIEDFHDHIKKLCQMIRNENTCFRCLQGYAWALEQGGIEGGLHCHLLLIYDGNKRQNDWYIAKEVGEKWKVITGGLGECYSYHDKETKQGYERNGKLGIGMIHRNEPQEVENAVDSALYLTKPSKEDQHLKVWLPNMNTFAHGRYRTSDRRGLPPISK